MWWLIFANVVAVADATTSAYQMPETLDGLRTQLSLFQGGFVENACKSTERPFLKFYDADNQPVCITEDEMLSLRLDPNTCNTKVTLGDKVDGGCSQYNFLNREGKVLTSFYNTELAEEDVMAVPLHRNVKHYHGGDAPYIRTQSYYTMTKYLPCDMHSDENAQSKKNSDLSGGGTEGYCDVKQIVKDKLCWTGVGSYEMSAISTDERQTLFNGVAFKEEDPCDVMQHLNQHASRHVVSVLNPYARSDESSNENILDAVAQQLKDIELEAYKQGCEKSGVISLQNLKNTDYYHGDDGRIVTGNHIWSDQKNKGENVCRADDVNCIDTNGNPCYSDSDECDVHNVHTYTSSGLLKCFRQKITRTWTDTVEWNKKKITKREYEKEPTNWQAYFERTPSKTDLTGGNACDNTENMEQCRSACYDTCKAMKFPGFSIAGKRGCRCSDYSMDTCPQSQKRTTNSNRRSYSISPICETADCNKKTSYSDELRPCQFTSDYNKRKCMETCANENALFMTISAKGLCLCSAKKHETHGNEEVDFKTGQVCPWDAATRVYKDSTTLGGRGYGYDGDSFVTTEPIETYQLKYNSYYGDDQNPQDGILICENGGSPGDELRNWYERLTGESFDTVDTTTLKALYENLEE